MQYKDDYNRREETLARKDRRIRRQKDQNARRTLKRSNREAAYA